MMGTILLETVYIVQMKHNNLKVSNYVYNQEPMKKIAQIYTAIFSLALDIAIYCNLFIKLVYSRRNWLLLFFNGASIATWLPTFSLELHHQENQNFNRNVRSLSGCGLYMSSVSRLTG